MRNIGKKAALAGFSLLIIFLMAEILLRTFAPIYLVGQLDWYQYDPELAIRLKPSMHALHMSDHQSEMKTNDLGTVNFQEKFDEYDQVIFVAGDSYTEGVGLASDASYPFQLDLDLNTRSGAYREDFAVINLGLAAYGADQAILAIKRWSNLIAEPDYILYFGCSNDFEDDVRFQSGYRHQHLIDGNPRYGIWVDPLQWMLDEIQVLKRMKFAAARIRNRFRATTRAKESPPEARSGLDEHGLKNVARRQEPKFDELLELANSLGATLIVSWTDFPGKDHGSYAWLKDWARRNGARFADWHPLTLSIRSAIPNLPVNNSHSGGHYRTWINSVIARAYADQIEAAGTKKRGGLPPEPD